MTLLDWDLPLTPLRSELIAAATATLRRHARGWDDYCALCEALGLEADE